jgi:NhaP-type Na+/H+ or K+/H+ antiporter
MTLIILFVALIFAYSLFSKRAERTVLTAPILFTVAGMLALVVMPELRGRKANLDAFLLLAEVGLVLLLFTDASRTDLQVLKNIRALPVRLLSTGMLLTIMLGGVCALVVFGNLSLWEAGILAAILAPTDAGLGQVIVNSPKVPMKIRQALNVEAGLNDGLSVPFLLFFIGLAGAGDDASLGKFVVEQLGYGAAVGIGVGLAGGWLIGWARRRELVAESWQQICVVALPLFCIFASEAMEASMFIAAFVAGLAVQVKFKEAGKHSVEFTEEWGQLFNLSVFFLFGFFVARDWPQVRWTHVVYAVLSLTLVRMLPVGVALLGTKLSRATVFFVGWFGPRGLASIVLGLVYLEQKTHQPGRATIYLAVLVTVLFSILAHGLSAMPGMEWYARRIRDLPPDAPEREEFR